MCRRYRYTVGWFLYADGFKNGYGNNLEDYLKLPDLYNPYDSNPVSYTHLDVYKRQSECRGFESHLPPAKKRKFERIFLFFCYCTNNSPKGGNVESM